MRIKYFLIFILILLGGCKSIEITSYWRDHEIKIDGNGDDWQGKTWLIKDFPNVVVGFMNDDKFLYLSLTVSDRLLQRQIAFGGVTLWFDRNGGDDKKFGIRYPLPMMREGQFDRRQRESERGREPDTSWIFPDNFSYEIDIEGPMANEHHRLPVQESGGIEAALHHSRGLLVYEMKIPLMDTGPQPYVIGSAPGSTIGVGIESGMAMNPEREKNRPRFGGGEGDGEGGGGFGDRRGGGFDRGGERNLERGKRAEPLKLWVKVQLAEPNSSK